MITSDERLRELTDSIAVLNQQVDDLLMEMKKSGAFNRQTKAGEEAAKQYNLLRKIRDYELERDELLPNIEIIRFFGKRFHDIYKHQHAINHETKLQRVPDGTKSYEVLIQPETIVAADLPVIKMPLTQTRLLRFEDVRVDHIHIYCGFFPTDNVLFWARTGK